MSKSKRKLDDFKAAVVRAAIEHSREFHCGDISDFVSDLGLEMPKNEIEVKFEITVRSTTTSESMLTRARAGDADDWVAASFEIDITGDNDGGDIDDAETVIKATSIRLVR